jgi:hypothetical protein
MVIILPSYLFLRNQRYSTVKFFLADSIFFVCDNSTTGHICNDIWNFIPGSLCQTNKFLTTANSTGPCHQEGTVQIQLLDNNGTNHIFIVYNCLYRPDSPVNLLSARRIAEKYIFMLMETLTTKLELNLDTLLMYWLCHLGIFRRHSQLQFLVSQRDSSMNVLGYIIILQTGHVICNYWWWATLFKHYPFWWQWSSTWHRWRWWQTNQHVLYDQWNSYILRRQRNYTRDHLPWTCSNRWNIESQDKNL